MYYRHVCTTCYSAIKKAYKDSVAFKLIEYKKTLECERCGNEDHRVLDFHHYRDDKHFNIADGVNNVSWETLLAEINKCECVCSNCHRIEHSGTRRLHYYARWTKKP